MQNNRLSRVDKIDDTENDSTIGSFTSDVITADFDGIDDGDPTTYEGATARHDSGGGWFIKVGNTWKVAGLSRAVEYHGEDDEEQSWFRNSITLKPDPDYIDAVRISSYAAWIYDTIPEYVPGDLTGDGWVDFADFAVFTQHWLDECESPDWCKGADFEPDGDVDWDDLAFLADKWLTGHKY